MSVKDFLEVGFMILGILMSACVVIFMGWVTIDFLKENCTHKFTPWRTAYDEMGDPCPYNERWCKKCGRRECAVE